MKFVVLPGIISLVLAHSADLFTKITAPGATYTAFNVDINSLNQIVDLGYDIAETLSLDVPFTDHWVSVKSPHVTTFFYGKSSPPASEFKYDGAECNFDATHLFWWDVSDGTEGLLGVVIRVPDDSISCPQMLTNFKGESLVINPKSPILHDSSPIRIANDQYAHITVSISTHSKQRSPFLIEAVDTGIILRELSNQMNRQIAPHFGFAPHLKRDEDSSFANTGEQFSLNVNWKKELKKSVQTNVKFVKLPDGITINGVYKIN